MPTIDLSHRYLENIKFKPNLDEEITQNLFTIISTFMDTVPLFRDFAIDRSILDNPINVVQAKYNNLIINKVKEYEPRVKIMDIDYSKSDFSIGKIVPVVNFKVIANG